RDDAVLETEGRGVFALHLDRPGVGEPGVAADELDAAPLCQLSHAPGELSHHILLNEGPQLVEIELRLAEGDAVFGHLAGFADDLGGMQERLTGNAAAIDADAAEFPVFIDQA